MRALRWSTLLSFALVTACGIATPVPTPTAAPTPTEFPAPASPDEEIFIVIDDFEAGETAWRAGLEPEFADSSALGVALTGESVTQGSQALRLDFEQDDRPKAIFLLDRPLDLSRAPFLQFDLYNTGSAAAVVLAVTVGQDQIWYESRDFPLAAGVHNRVVFDLTAGDFKAASTNWEFRAAISDLDQVHRLAIIIIPAGSGSVALDNVLLTDTPPVR